MSASAELPTNINISGARLPASYDSAKSALAHCAEIDECIDWADRAAALASYAKQADDDELHKYATRIRARAIRRAGELLKQIEPAPGARSDLGRATTRGSIASNAGMSPHQAKQALRVASVPNDAFEEALESGGLVTVTKIAAMGTKPVQPKPTPPDYLQGRDPETFQAATRVMGAMRRFVDAVTQRTATYVAAGILPAEVEEAREMVATIDAWLDSFVVNLKA